MFKKYCIIFVCLTLTLLLILGGTVFAVDPFYHYRAPSDMKELIYQNPLYQNVGIAKFTDFDTLITGTSMTQNFRAWWFDDAFGCKAIRLSYDGGNLFEFGELLSTATKYNEQLKTIYFGLDNYLIAHDSVLIMDKSKTPEYLTDSNILNDVNYLFNKDVIFDKLKNLISYMLFPHYDFYEMNAWDNNPEFIFSKKKLLSDYSIPEKSAQKPDDYFLKYATQTSYFLEIYVKENPDIDFIFFAPPYSILYWCTQHFKGNANATISALKSVYSALLQYDNVRIFYFQNDEAMITDLDKYKDSSHYHTDYNKYMLDCFKSGKHEITAENYEHELNKMLELASSYDYDALWSSVTE